MGKVKKSKRWGGEWTRVGKRGEGVPRPNAGRLQVQEQTCGTEEEYVGLLEIVEHFIRNAALGFGR